MWMGFNLYRIFLTDTVSKPYQREKIFHRGSFMNNIFEKNISALATKDKELATKDVKDFIEKVESEGLFE